SFLPWHIPRNTGLRGEVDDPRKKNHITEPEGFRHFHPKPGKARCRGSSRKGREREANSFSAQVRGGGSSGHEAIASNPGGRSVSGSSHFDDRLPYAPETVRRGCRTDSDVSRIPERISSGF